MPRLSPDEIAKAMRDPSTRTHVIELTPELKERLTKIGGEIIDELVKRTRGPEEAYMVLDFVMSSLREVSGIKIAGQFDGVNDATE